MKTRDRLHHRFLLSRDPVVLTNYKKSRNVVKRSLRDAERKYTFKEVEENKHQAYCEKLLITSFRQKYKREDEFNLYFSSVVRSAANTAGACLAAENSITLSEPSSVPQIPASAELFSCKPVTCEDARRIILKTGALKQVPWS